MGRAARCARSIDGVARPRASVGAPTTWVLSNHDVVRHAYPARLAPAARGLHTGIGVDDPQPDAALGLRRARAAIAAHARAARLGLPLPGRGARPARGTPTCPTTVAPGPDVASAPGRRARPRRLPGADPVGGRRARRYGFSADRRDLAAAAASLARPTRWTAQRGVAGSTLELYRDGAAAAARAPPRRRLAAAGWTPATTSSPCATATSPCWRTSGATPVDLPAARASPPPARPGRRAAADRRGGVAAGRLTRPTADRAGAGGRAGGRLTIDAAGEGGRLTLRRGGPARGRGRT